jgi:hypothetical protein
MEELLGEGKDGFSRLRAGQDSCLRVRKADTLASGFLRTRSPGLGPQFISAHRTRYSTRTPFCWLGILSGTRPTPSRRLRAPAPARQPRNPALRLLLSRHSTAAYAAPPRRVRAMPAALRGVMVRLKRATERRIVRTCLMFAGERSGKHGGTVDGRTVVIENVQ